MYHEPVKAYTEDKYPHIPAEIVIQRPVRIPDRDFYQHIPQESVRILDQEIYRKSPKTPPQPTPEISVQEYISDQEFYKRQDDQLRILKAGKNCLLSGILFVI
jgi:hypothetical protein